MQRLRQLLYYNGNRDYVRGLSQLFCTSRDGGNMQRLSWLLCTSMDGGNMQKLSRLFCTNRDGGTMQRVCRLLCTSRKGGNMQRLSRLLSLRGKTHAQWTFSFFRSHLDDLWAQPHLQHLLLSAINFRVATVSKLWNSGQWLKFGSHCAILATIWSSETHFENPKRFL